MAKKKRATKKKPSKLSVETIVHEDASRYNIPTAELESVMEQADKSPIRVAYELIILRPNRGAASAVGLRGLRRGL